MIPAEYALCVGDGFAAAERRRTVSSGSSAAGRVIRHAGLCIALSLVAGRWSLAACPGALLACHDQLDRGPDSDRCAEARPGPVLAGSSGQHQLSLGVLAGWGVGARPKMRRTITMAAVMMAAVSPEV